MEFPNCKVKAVKADIANGDITISFSLALNDASLEMATMLGSYVDKDMGKVEVRVIPNQPPLALGGVAAEFKTSKVEQS